MDDELLFIDELEDTLPVEQISDPTESNGVGSEIVITGYVTQDDFYEFKEELFEEIREEEFSLWDKPFDKYTVSEGYLLLIFILLLWLVISRLIGGVIKR